MADEDEDPPGYDPPELHCRHLLVCRNAWYHGSPDDGYSLGRVLVHARPADDDGFPVRFARLFLFAQLFGTPGEYTVRVRQVWIDPTEDGDEESDPRDFGPWDVLVSGEDFVETFVLPLSDVAFGRPGVYEFQFSVDGFDAPLARERIEARG